MWRAGLRALAGATSGLAPSPGAFPGRRYTLSRLAPQFTEVERLCRATGYALVPQSPQPLKIFLPQLAFELPVTDGFTDDFAGGRVFAGLDRGFDRGDLLTRRGDADLMDIRHVQPRAALHAGSKNSY